MKEIQKYIFVTHKVTTQVFQTALVILILQNDPGAVNCFYSTTSLVLIYFDSNGKSLENIV